MTGVDHAEVAKPLRQVAPGDARAIAIEHGFDEQPIVSGRHVETAVQN
jgi:hypothetical protein